MVVVLIGMKHCGKSTLGRGLARRWRCAFFDVDELLEKDYARQAAPAGAERVSAREIFRREGEAGFAELEARVVRQLAEKLAAKNERAVVAVGGRTALNPAAQGLLRGLGRVVYLKAQPQELLKRVRRGEWPAFVDEKDPEGDFLRFCAQREPQYEHVADTVVEVSGLGVNEALARLAGAVEECGDGG